MPEETSEARRLSTALEVLIANHTTDRGEHPIYVSEIHNVLVPGSRPLRRNTLGTQYTCELCHPELSA